MQNNTKLKLTKRGECVIITFLTLVGVAIALFLIMILNNNAQNFESQLKCVEGSVKQVDGTCIDPEVNR